MPAMSRHISIHVYKLRILPMWEKTMKKTMDVNCLEKPLYNYICPFCVRIHPGSTDYEEIRKFSIQMLTGSAEVLTWCLSMARVYFHQDSRFFLWSTVFSSPYYAVVIEFKCVVFLPLKVLGFAKQHLSGCVSLTWGYTQWRTCSQAVCVFNMEMLLQYHSEKMLEAEGEVQCS